MTTEGRILKLMTWLSPAFPVGAFGYSHGLETAIREGAVTDAEGLVDWISDLIRNGSGWTDAVLFRAAWTAGTARDCPMLAELAELAEALAPSLERKRETLAQGEAFGLAIQAWGEPLLTGAVAYPIAVGAACGDAGVPATLALAAWLHAFCAMMVSVAVRTIPIGQTDAVGVIAALESTIVQTAARAATATLDDLGSSTLRSDIAAMRHETLGVRLFIS